MEQSIKLTILDQEFPLKAKSPEHERLLRMAAEQVNNTKAQFDVKFPDRSLEQKMAFVGLQLAAEMLRAQGELETIRAEVKKLKEDTDAYLSKTGK